jgi:hypothetical protein
MFLIFHIGVSILKNIAFSNPNFGPPRGKIFLVSDSSLFVGCSLYKCAKFQLYASSRSGIAFLEKHTFTHIHI